MGGRFTAPVVPGDELTVQLWRAATGVVHYRTINQRGDAVIDAGRLEYTE
jgi:acyl dehydratase